MSETPRAPSPSASESPRPSGTEAPVETATRDEAEVRPAPAEPEAKPAPAAPPAREQQERGSLLQDEDRIWLSETAESARAGNANISVSAPTEAITIATATVEGRVRRVRPHLLEVTDAEGNLYELHLDQRSRGVRQGHRVSLHTLAAGTPVRASFDLLGGGQSLARDIVLRR